MDNALPTGKISRGKVVGKTLLKIGLKKGKYFIRQEKEENRHEEIADIIFDALGELKGVSVKIAQQVALGMPFLPPAYLDKISKSFHSIPGINKPKSVNSPNTSAPESKEEIIPEFYTS